MKYEVFATEVHLYRWEVEADSHEEAELVVSEDWDKGRQTDCHVDEINSYELGEE